jgi:hypothetical protein
MALGANALKVACGAGTAASTLLSAVVVSADTKPDGAPLRPPLNAQAVPGGGSQLVIPSTPVCPGNPSKKAKASSPAQPALSPRLQQALTDLRAAKSAADRQRIYAGLTTDERTEVMALLQARAAAPGAVPCRSGGSSGAPSDQGGISSHVVDITGPGQSLSNSTPS